MKKFEEFRKAGNFTLSEGVNVQGELILKDAATTLDLYSNAAFNTHVGLDIFGIFYDQSKASLIDCITSGSKTSYERGEQYYFSSVFPHFVILGDRHIGSTDRAIRNLSFTIDDAPVLFFTPGTFGTVIDASPHLKRIAESEAKERDWKIEVGEHPHIFYYTGKDEIFATETELGKVSATNGISYSMPGPTGIHVNNTIRLNIAFRSERTVKEAVESVLDVLKFFEIMAGRPQNVTKLSFILESTETRPQVLDVYWCMPPQRDQDNEWNKCHPADLPIRAGMEPVEFSNVLKRWLERHDAWRDARWRFSTVFANQMSYGIDRVIGAANMFDILPLSACPAATILGKDLEQAKENARTMFRSLPPSPERDSVLSALGRIGTASLKRKVQSRAKLITDLVGDQFPELDIVTDQAVDCRNYYVHGSIAKIDYSKHFDQVMFFVDTLEFVFAASDLVESGWDISAWIKLRSSHSHPFGRYRIDYLRQLQELKKLL